MFLQKIPVLKLLDLLGQLHNQGVDFFDLEIVISEGETNTMRISYIKDYINKDYQHLYDLDTPKEEKDPDLNSPISDEDINQLI